MAHLPSLHDIGLVLNLNKKIYCRVELLDKKMRAIDSLEGETISCSFSVDAESSIRNTLTLSMIVPETDIDIKNFSTVWFDKFFRVYAGYNDIKLSGDDAITWYLMGTYILSDGQYNWDSVTSTLTLSCVDLAAWLDGTRNGYVRGLITKIEEGSSIRNSLISLITQEAGLERYRIDVEESDSGTSELGEVAEFNLVPYDMEFSNETSVWQKIEQIKELYPGWEAFFDRDGTFVFQKIPTLESDSCILDDSVLHSIVRGEPVTIPFSGISNVVDLYGSCIEADISFSSCKIISSPDSTSEGSWTYVFYPEGVEELKTFDPSDIPQNTKIQISNIIDLPVDNRNHIKIALSNEQSGTNESKHFPIVYQDGSEVPRGAFNKDKLYVLKYRYDTDRDNNKINERVVLLGEPQIHAICKHIAFYITDEEKEYDRTQYENCEYISYRYNPDSPFAITEMWNEDHKNDIRLPLSGGEYENIMSCDLALQRAEYECWKSTQLQEQIDFPMIAVPFLDVNQKIEYTSFRTKEKRQYITKKISGDLMDGTMDVTAIMFYPLYPSIVSERG